MLELFYKIAICSAIILIILLFIVYCFRRMTEKFKTKELVYKSVINNLLTALFLMILDFLDIVVKFIFLLTLFSLLPKSLIKQILKSVSDFYFQSSEMGNIIIGAFLASTLGILTQKYMDYTKDKKEIRKYSRVLYNDLKDIISTFDIIHTALRAPEFSSIDVWSLNIINHINFDHNWRENYSYLTQSLPNTYYTKISSIYGTADLFNKSVEDKDLDAIYNCIASLTLQDKFTMILGFPSPTNEILLEDLKGLSMNRKIKKINIKILVGELFYISKKRKLFNTVEKEAIEIIRKDGNQKINTLTQKIDKRLNNSGNKYYKGNMKDKDRLIFEILHSSKHIKYVWDECSLIDEKD